MNRIVAGGLRPILVATVATGIALLFTSGIRARVLDVYLLVVGGLVLLTLVRVTRILAPRGTSAFERALQRPSGKRSLDLALEREVELSVIQAFHLHVRLRPILREIAAQRLLARHGIELDREPTRARPLVGDRAWEIVRPDRPPPQDRLSRGPSLADLRAVVTELERL